VLVKKLLDQDSDAIMKLRGQQPQIDKLILTDFGKANVTIDDISISNLLSQFT
jgi:hypothetical protein